MVRENSDGYLILQTSLFRAFVSDAMKWKEVMWCLMLLEFHVFHLCESTKTASKMGGEVSEKSLKVSNEAVEEAGVKHTGIFLLRFVFYFKRVEHTPKVE